MIQSKFLFLISFLTLFTGSTAFSQIDLKNKVGGLLGGSLSNDQVGEGLKEALTKGAGKASDVLSLKDGYFLSPYKILLPQEAQQVVSKVKNIPGFGNVEDELVEKLNRAAEDAASKAKPIFVDAIKKLTLSDVMNILMGNNDAATRYLEKTTYQSLYDEFRPVILTSLNTVNAAQYWETIVSKYNSLPLVKKVNPKLDDYVTGEALKGLFKVVEKEEKDIRNNPAQRTSDLLKKVFAKQDSNRK